jgi:quercetin dioxygenase-like cupin family protein
MGFAAGCTRRVPIRVGTVCGPGNSTNAKGGITDMRDEKAHKPEDGLEICRPVQAFDATSTAKRLREEKTYEAHGRSVLSLFHGPSLQAMLTAIASGRRTGERRVASPSTVHVLEGEVRFEAGEERHVLSAGGTLVLEGNVSYEAEALSDAVFLHTLVRPTDEDRSLPPSAHPTEPAEGARIWIFRGPIMLRDDGRRSARWFSSDSEANSQRSGWTRREEGRNR